MSSPSHSTNTQIEKIPVKKSRPWLMVAHSNGKLGRTLGGGRGGVDGALIPDTRVV